MSIQGYGGGYRNFNEMRTGYTNPAAGRMAAERAYATEAMVGPEAGYGVRGAGLRPEFGDSYATAGLNRSGYGQDFGMGMAGLHDYMRAYYPQAPGAYAQTSYPQLMDTFGTRAGYAPALQGAFQNASNYGAIAPGQLSGLQNLGDAYFDMQDAVKDYYMARYGGGGGPQVAQTYGNLYDLQAFPPPGAQRPPSSYGQPSYGPVDFNTSLDNTLAAYESQYEKGSPSGSMDNFDSVIGEYARTYQGDPMSTEGDAFSRRFAPSGDSYSYADGDESPFNTGGDAFSSTSAPSTDSYSYADEDASPFNTEGDAFSSTSPPDDDSYSYPDEDESFEG